MRSFLAVAIVLFCLPILQAAPDAKPSPEESATVSALLWLKLIDDHEYGPSWEQAAEYFRGALGKEKWEQSLQGVRGPLGDVKIRKAVETRHATSLPGAPDGQYYVIVFDTEFSQKERATETVTLMLDKDGIWRAAGYFVK